MLVKKPFQCADENLWLITDAGIRVGLCLSSGMILRGYFMFGVESLMWPRYSTSTVYCLLFVLFVLCYIGTFTCTV